MNKMKQKRIERGLLQSDVARDLGITPEYYSNIEREVNVPSPRLRVKIAEFYGTSVDDLFNGKTIWVKIYKFIFRK